MIRQQIVTTVVGVATDDPELRFTPNGLAVCETRVSVTTRRKNKQTNEWEDQPATHVKVVTFGDAAERTAETIKAGWHVLAFGQIEVRTYEKRDGNRGVEVQVKADAFAPMHQHAERSTAATRPADDPWATGPSPRTADEWANEPGAAPPF